jgi:Tol biopolymer transport system component
MRRFLGRASFVSALFALTATAGAFERVNLTSAGGEATGGVTWTPSASADGRYVVFTSNAPLIPTDTNSDFDIYLRDRVAGTTTCVSVSTLGAPVGQSYNPVISANGRYVAFESFASELVTGDTNASNDVFVRDLVNGTTVRVSVSSTADQAEIMSDSSYPSISDDGRLVAFVSSAANLVAGDTNGEPDLFVHDLQSGTTTRINMGPAPGFAEANGMSSMPHLSGDGSTVVFRSFATTLTASPTNGNAHIFACDLATGAITLVSKNSEGDESDFDSGSSMTSSDGRYVVFDSMAGNLAPGDDATNDVDIFLHDRETGATSRVSRNSAGVKQDGMSASPSISADGSLIAFTSNAGNLAPEASGSFFNLYVHRIATGETALISKGYDGAEGDDSTYEKAVFVENGNAIVFESSASNLVLNDTNMTHDIFYLSLNRNLQPDNLLSKSASIGAGVGGDVYNTTAAGQALKLLSKKAKAVNAYLFVQNDGTQRDAFRVRGQVGNAFIPLSYFAGSKNVTGAVKSGSYNTGSLAVGANRMLKIAATPVRSKVAKVRNGKTVWLRKTCSAVITSTSMTDPTKSDAVRLQVEHR